MTTEIDAALDEGAKPPSPAQTGRPQPPRCMQRWLARLPLGLYRAGLGGLLGQRFLMLTHTGRKSGQRRHVVLEVVRYDKVTSTIIIVSGFGIAADWFRNISRHPKVTVHIGGRQFLLVLSNYPGRRLWRNSKITVDVIPRH